MVMNLILVWVRSPCSHSDPCRWQLGLLQMEASQMMNSPLLHRLVYTDVLYERHWLGNWLEQKIPSEIGTSAGSHPRVLSLGTSGTRDLPLSLLSSSARQVLERILLLIVGLTDGPDVSVLDRACTCPTIRSSPSGRRKLWLPDSTIASRAGSSWSRDYAPSGNVCV